jgi:hypothetical protein
MVPLIDIKLSNKGEIWENSCTTNIQPKVSVQQGDKRASLG